MYTDQQVDSLIKRVHIFKLLWLLQLEWTIVVQWGAKCTSKKAFSTVSIQENIRSLAFLSP